MDSRGSRPRTEENCLIARRTLEYPDGGREVVDAPGGSEGSDDNAGRGHEIVGEGVVEVALQLEDVLHALELLLVSARAEETKGQHLSTSINVRTIRRSSLQKAPQDHTFSSLVETSEQVCACILPCLQHPHVSLPTNPTSPHPPPICSPRTKSSVPGGELLKGLLVVGVVGIDVAGELAGGDGESGALLLEDGSRGRAGEGGDCARARGAAEEGGDRHCVWL